MRVTHTYVHLPVSAATHDEIRRKLLCADYGEQVNDKTGEIYMQGIALVVDQREAVAAARELAVEAWGERWVDSEWNHLTEFAEALSRKAPLNEG